MTSNDEDILLFTPLQPQITTDLDQFNVVVKQVPHYWKQIMDSILIINWFYRTALPKQFVQIQESLFQFLIILKITKESDYPMENHTKYAQPWETWASSSEQIFSTSDNHLEQNNYYSTHDKHLDSQRIRQAPRRPISKISEVENLIENMRNCYSLCRNLSFLFIFSVNNTWKSLRFENLKCCVMPQLSLERIVKVISTLWPNLEKHLKYDYS